jgi:putative transposase
MPRARRVAPPNSLHHVINRGNRKETIFAKPADFQEFLALMGEACTRVPVRVVDYCLMGTHFHLVLWQKNEGDLSAYMQWLMNVHVRRYAKHYDRVGHGHIYQGRFKNFLVEPNIHLLRVCRYVVANPLRAGIVERAELWPWSSLSPSARDANRPPLSDPPLQKPPHWTRYVNDEIPLSELQRLRLSRARCTPYGDPSWVFRTIVEHDLFWTIRAPGRPAIDESMLPVE